MYAHNKITALKIVKIVSAIILYFFLFFEFNYPLLFEITLPSLSVKLPTHIIMKSIIVHIPHPPQVSNIAMAVPIFPT